MTGEPGDPSVNPGLQRSRGPVDGGLGDLLWDKVLDFFESPGLSFVAVPPKPPPTPRDRLRRGPPLE